MKADETYEVAAMNGNLYLCGQNLNLTNLFY